MTLSNDGEVGPVLVELSVVEQRYQAVLDVVRDGMTVTEVAGRLGVSRQSVHRWIARYRGGGLGALADRSHRPASCPHQLDTAVEARVCQLRQAHPGWGPRRLVHQLGREGVVVSRSSVYRALVRNGLIPARPRRRRREDYLRWERGRPMELWQLDVVGGIALSDGTELKALTGIDDHSRFCVAAGLMTRATARAVCGVFVAAIRAHGVPEEVLTDNGKVFTGRFGPRPVEVLFDRICRENGITHRLTAARSPTTTGKIERFHRTLREEFLAGASFDSLLAAQSALDAWVGEYNTDRPHQSLGMLTPAQRFAIGSQRADAVVAPALPELEPDRRAPGQWVTRRVATNGIVSVDCQVFSVGKRHAGQLVTVHVSDVLFEVWANGALIRSVPRRRRGVVRNLRAHARGSLSDTG